MTHTSEIFPLGAVRWVSESEVWAHAETAESEDINKTPLVGMKPPQVSFVDFCVCSIFSIKVVAGDSWGTFGIELKVQLYVLQNHQRWPALARKLQPEIPLTEYTTTAFYSPDESSRARPRLGLKVRVLSRQHHRVLSRQHHRVLSRQHHRVPRLKRCGPIESSTRNTWCDVF